MKIKTLHTLFSLPFGFCSLYCSFLHFLLFSFHPGDFPTPSLQLLKYKIYFNDLNFTHNSSSIANGLFSYIVISLIINNYFVVSSNNSGSFTNLFRWLLVFISWCRPITVVPLQIFSGDYSRLFRSVLQ